MPLTIRGNANGEKQNLNNFTSTHRDIMVNYKEKPLAVERKDSVQTADFTLQKPKYKLDDVILEEKQYKSIQQAIGFYKYKEHLMEDWNMKIRYPENKGLSINLYGEPGTGKTMTAHAIAESLGKELLIVNYAEIESKYVGETSKNLVHLFEFAQEKDAVLLFDEADALLSKRVTNMTNSTDVSVNQTKSVLLNILNDFYGTVVFTTNFISNYDHAFMRRIPFQIRFSLPNAEQRKSLWKYYLSTDMPYRLDVDWIAEKYDGVSGSDISNCVLMAALHTAMENKEIVAEECFFEVMENILQAKKENQAREPRIISQREVSEEYVMEQLRGKGATESDALKRTNTQE